MYNHYFGFRASPFSISIEVPSSCLDPPYQDAYNGLLSAIREQFGFIVLTGEAGTGKTALVHHARQKMAENFFICYSATCPSDFEELLALPCLHFQPSSEHPTTAQTFDAILKAGRQTRKRVLLFLDEAHQLSQEVLECLQVLSDLKTHTTPLLSVILIGRSELRTKLKQVEFGRFWDRVDVHLQVPPLDEEEVESFLQSRLRAVGCERADLFTQAARQRIAFYSRGLLRLVNLLCDNALIAAFMAQQHTISAASIEQIAHELSLEPPRHTGIPEEMAPPSATLPSIAVPPVEDTVAALLQQPIAVGLHYRSRPLVWASLAAAFVVLLSLKFLVNFNSLEIVPKRLQQIATVSLTAGWPTPTNEPSLFALYTEHASEQTLPVTPPSTNDEAPLRQATQTLPDKYRDRQIPLATPPFHASSPILPVAQSHKQKEPGSLVKIIPAQRRNEAQIYLAERGIETNEATLLKSIESGNTTLVRLLLQAGVSANTKDKQDWTALMLAARDGQVDLVQLLLTCGGEVNTKNKMGATALMLAAMNNHPGIVQTLLAKGAKVDAHNRQGWTALMYAAWKGHRPIVETLLHAGANTGARDKNGWTASMYARWQNDTPPDRPWITGMTRVLWGENSEPFDLASETEYASIATRLEQTTALSK